MSSVGGVGGSSPVVPDPTVDDTTPAPAAATSDTSATASRTATSTMRPLIGTGTDTDLDGLTDSVETRVGLDPTSPRSERTIGDRQAWDIPGSGYAAFGDDAVTIAVHKYASVFGSKEAAASAGNSYWESYGSGKTGLPSGSWLPDAGAEISESDFESVTGVNIWGDKKIGDTAYKLLRQSNAPHDASFAARKSSGRRHPARSSDRFVPTIAGADGKFKQVKLTEAGRWGGSNYVDPENGKAHSSSEVVWRLQTSKGAIRGRVTDKVETRDELLDIRYGMKFDFMDAQGRTIALNRSAGDKVAATWKDGDHTMALRPNYNRGGRISSYTRYKIDKEGKTVEKKRTSLSRGNKLLGEQGQNVIHRIQTKSGQLKGDGKVGDSYDMSWWGRCQNVATIDQSNVKQPDRDMKIVSNLNRAAGEELALSFTDDQGQHVLAPSRDGEGKVTGYTHKVLGPRGGLRTGTSISIDDAKELAKKGNPIIVKSDGSLKEATYELVTSKDATMLTALMDDGATDYKGSIGNRYWGYPDTVTTTDGQTLEGKIVDVETKGGQKIDIVRKSGREWKDSNSAILRGNDFEAAKRYMGFRSTAWTTTTMDGINARREGDDRIDKVVFEHADGRRETLDASKIGAVGRENLYDLTPADIWKAGTWIEDGKSFTTEKYAGEQVWNYGTKSIATERIATCPAGLAEKNKLPGALAGTVGDEDKVYFKTKLETVGGTVDLTYWAKMGDDGNIEDFNWLSGSPPDFFWRSHVKDPVAERWTGEGNVAGTNMADIQKIYNATTGAYGSVAVFDAISLDDMKTWKPETP
ncbi:hypothetical protein ACFL59_05080 [Planctomycetota bacterium]